LGHGTHTAGTIASAANGVGIVGVAPNVRIASVKAISPDFFLYPEMIVCAFVWAGTHHMNVTNNSYFADPWLFNCRNDPEQRAIWNAERRAIKYAMSQGVVVVAAAGNFADDLAHPTQDIISPDNTPGETRRIRNDCAVIPVEIPGVIGVSGDGNLGIKSYFSNYGSGVIQVTAPSGDDFLQVTPAAPNGTVLSTIQPGSFYESILPPSFKVFDCSVSPCAEYLYLEGTSMAAPHVTGVAALIESQYGRLSPGRVAAMITQTADSIACPDPATLALYSPFTSVSNGAPQTCTGGAGYNSWYGHGQVNALSAVTRAP
jgi:subtilisin family serine protease